MVALQELPWPVHTERLSLRAAVAADAEPVWNYRRDEETSRWLTGAAGDLPTFRSRFVDPARLPRTLVIERDGLVIGDLMVRVTDAWAQVEIADRARATQAEIGWCLRADVVGHGYATEAVRALLVVCFDGLGLRRVTANCFADNQASARLMRRLGMRLEAHTVADSLHRDGEWRDGLAFALLASEWRGAVSAAGRSAGSR